MRAEPCNQAHLCCDCRQVFLPSCQTANGPHTPTAASCRADAACASAAAAAAATGAELKVDGAFSDHVHTLARYVKDKM